MNISSISDLSRQYMLSALGAARAKEKTQTATEFAGALTSAAASSNQRSPFALVLASLQQLQQTSPAQYAKVSQQISTNLAEAANKAQVEGKSKLAAQLNTFSRDFAESAQSGKVPSVQDLETATSSHHLNPLKLIGQALNLAGL